MLGNKKAGFNSTGGTTLISQDTTVVGDVQFSGSLDVEGLVQGNVVAEPGKDAVVRIIGKGRVEGDIRVPCVIVNGEVIGDVYAGKQLELASKARVQGNVFYNLVEMAAGSEVNGSMKHTGETHGKAEGQEKAEAGRDKGAPAKVD